MISDPTEMYFMMCFIHMNNEYCEKCYTNKFDLTVIITQKRVTDRIKNK